MKKSNNFVEDVLCIDVKNREYCEKFCEAEEIFKMKSDKILEILISLFEKEIFNKRTVEKYIELIKGARTIADLNEIEYNLIQKKKLEIARRGIIRYILDYKEKHLIIDKTKKELFKMICDVNSLEDLTKVEEEIESIIKEESNEIITEYNRLYNRFSLENVEYQEIRELKK